jgi:hypothetical protein
MQSAAPSARSYSPLQPCWLDQVCTRTQFDPPAAVGRLIEAFDEVLDLRQRLLIPHGLGRLVDVHHYGPLEVGDGAGYGVETVIVGERTAVAGDVGELVEEGVVVVLSGHGIPQEAGRRGRRVSARWPIDRGMGDICVSPRGHKLTNFRQILGWPLPFHSPVAKDACK